MFYFIKELRQYETSLSAINSLVGCFTLEYRKCEHCTSNNNAMFFVVVVVFLT